MHSENVKARALLIMFSFHSVECMLILWIYYGWSCFSLASQTLELLPFMYLHDTQKKTACFSGLLVFLHLLFKQTLQTIKLSGFIHPRFYEHNKFVSIFFSQDLDQNHLLHPNLMMMNHLIKYSQCQQYQETIQMGYMKRQLI